MVWSDQLGAKPKHIADAAKLIPDPRAHHFWDGDEVIGRAFQTLDWNGRKVRHDGAAWDVWLLFDRDARWSSAPPQPAWWEHQLRDLPEERMLDAARFAARARALRAPPRKPVVGERSGGGAT